MNALRQADWRQTPPGRPSAEAIAALRAHSRFGEAIRSVSDSLVNLYQANRLINLVSSDRGRALLGYMALYLHYSRQPADPNSGLTAARLRSLCAEQRVCSAGRAEAMLALMRFAGHIAPAANAADRRLRILVPTEQMLELFRARWECQFRAIRLLIPEMAEALPALRRPDFEASFMRHMGDAFRAGVRLLEGSPDLGMFAERNAGMIILFSLTAAGDPDDVVPPSRPIAISISTLSRRFSVSRAHIVKLFHDAGAAGLVQRTGAEGNLIALSPRLADAVQTFFATTFLYLAACAANALDEVGCDNAVA